MRSRCRSKYLIMLRLYRKYNSKKIAESTGNKLKDMMKGLSKHNLDLDNEIIRKKREEKQQKEDNIKQQTILDDLQSRLARAEHDLDDDVNDVRTELERKLRKIKNLRDMIRDLKAKIRSSNYEKNNKAKRVAQGIEPAIDQINIPSRPVRPVAGKGISKTHIYSGKIIKEEHIPL
jgi:predicted  nucleic acid-binding Zn-ribbon protein